MTTLRTFQNEIEDIHHREISKQRAQALADKESQKHTNAKGKGKDDPIISSSTHNKLPGLEPTGQANFQEVVDRILVRLLLNR